METAVAPEISKDNIIARNILALKQLKDISEEFNAKGIPFIPIKGISLLETVYPDISGRAMCDIDILVSLDYISKIEGCMNKLDYTVVAGEPFSWAPSFFGLPVDFHFDIWYMTKSEMKNLLYDARLEYIGCEQYKLLSKEDTIIHSIAHTFIHHGYIDETWRNDVIAMFRVWGGSIDIKLLVNKAITYGLLTPFCLAFDSLRNEVGSSIAFEVDSLAVPYRNILSEKLLLSILKFNHPLKGHILRFLFLRNILEKLKYITHALFPHPAIIKRRYNVKNTLGMILAYIWRPLSFVVYTFRVIVKFVLKIYNYL